MTAASSTLTRGRGSEQTLETGPTYLAKLQCSRKTFGKLIRDGKGQPVAREGEKRRRNKGLIGSVHALILAITFLSEPLGLVLMWREDRTRQDPVFISLPPDNTEKREQTYLKKLHTPRSLPLS